MAKKNCYPIILRLLPLNREAPCSFRCCECCKIGAVVVIVIFVLSCPLLSRSRPWLLCHLQLQDGEGEVQRYFRVRFTIFISFFSNYKQGLKYKSKGLGTFKVYGPFCWAYIFATIPSENWKYIHVLRAGHLDYYSFLVAYASQNISTNHDFHTAFCVFVQIWTRER